MRKHAIFTAIAVTAVLFTACENVEIPEPNSGNAVEFRALVDKNGTTKASLVDKVDDLSSFFVTAWLEDQSEFMESAVWRTGAGQSDWEYAPKKYYPTDGTEVNFYAYSPIKDVNMVDNMGQHVDLVNNDGKVSFDYKVPKDQSVSNTAVDLLVAQADADKDNIGGVEFNFYHALSGVTFSAKNNNPEKSELVYVVSGIEITALANEGTFTYPFDTNSWVSNGSLETYLPGLPATGVSLIPTGSASTYKSLLSANDIMMVLPQTTAATGDLTNPNENGEPNDHTTASYVKVEFSLKDGSGTYIYEEGTNIYLPLPKDFIFKPGTLYNFQFQFEAMNVITFEVTKLENWVEENKVIPFP